MGLIPGGNEGITPRWVLQMRPPCRVVEPGDTSPWRMGLPMDLEPGNAIGSVPKSMVRDAAEESQPAGASGARRSLAGIAPSSSQPIETTRSEIMRR